MKIRMTILKRTIIAEDGTDNSYDIHSPAMTLNSDMITAINIVFLKLFPTLIAAATGMTISEDTSSTPTVAKLSDTTSARTRVNPIWNAPTLIPMSLAYVSSKLITIICLKKISNKMIDNAEIPANTYI